MKNLLSIGSNQYRERRPFLREKVKFQIWVILVIVLAALALILWGEYSTYLKTGRRVNIVSPIAVAAYAMEEPTQYVQPELAPQSEREAMVRVIKQVWRKDWKVGVALATCESGLDHTKRNIHNKDHTIDYGLFEVNSIHGMSPDDMMNAVANAGYAYSLYVEQHLNPWYSSRSCWEGKI